MIKKEQMKKEIMQAVAEVKETNPMVGSITNSVTINFVANAQLAVGGAAAMVYLPDEGEFLAKVAGATYINVGTLLPSNHTPAKPGAFKFVSRTKRLNGDAYAAPTLCATGAVATYLHSPSCSSFSSSSS